MQYQKHNYLIQVFKALGNSNRLKIVELLANAKKPITVNKICDEINLEQGLTSQHLTKLRDADIVQAKQEGLYMHYSLKDENIRKLLSL